MAIRYELSAAGVSVDSLLEQIATSTEVQTEQYKLLKESTASLIKMADNTALYTKNSLEDAANGLFAAGAASIAGSLSSIAITTVSLGVSLKLEHDAAQIAKEPVKIETEVVAEPVNRPAQENVPETAEQVAERKATEAKQAEDLKERQKQRDARAQQKSNQASQASSYGQSFASSIGQGINSSGTMLQGYYKQQEATDESLRQFYNSMPSIWNTISSMQNGTISTQEQNKQSDLAVWSAIVQASTAGMRG